MDTKSERVLAIQQLCDDLVAFYDGKPMSQHLEQFLVMNKLVLAVEV